VSAALLRREAFGGLLFVPEGALHIELDHEGFAFMHAHLTGGRAPRGEQEARLLEQILREVDGGSLTQARSVDYASGTGAFPFQVLMAPTLADFQITMRCPMGCPHCYAASEPEGALASLEEIERVLDQLRENGVTQVAIGGGEPLGHPDIIQVLERCRQRGMVPNLTTNGLYLDAARLAALKRCCGAVALSLEGVGARFDQVRKSGFAFFEQRLHELMDHGVATVLQVTLSQESFAELEDIIDFCLGHPGLYGVLFLAYKEVGRGDGFHHALAALPPERVHRKLREGFLRLSRQTRVGYDCCLTPAVVGVEPALRFSQADQLDGCSALRSSMGILPNLDVVPCTFTPGMAVGNLGRESLYEIWRGQQASEFRLQVQRRLRGDSQCARCPSQLECLGGCPVFDLVGCARRSM
jgi:radical SAM protein with 4Fe4S-binding SPASM domain